MSATTIRRLSWVALLLVITVIAAIGQPQQQQQQQSTSGSVAATNTRTKATTTTMKNNAHLRSTATIPIPMGMDMDKEYDTDIELFGGDRRSLQQEEITSNSNVNASIVVDQEFCDAQCPYEEPTTWVSAVPFALQIIMIIVLILLSALFSGLTLGLMGLDKTGLEIVMEGDDPVSARNAGIIYPLRKNGNLLLCTLLLGNVAVNALLSILLADKAGGAVGFISSTFLIVIFGEIIPQAACSRYALQIGSKTVPLVKVIMFLVYPIAAPLAFALDKVS